LCLNALAACGEGCDCAGDLEPFSEVGGQLEADVGLGIVAVAVPGGGDGVEGSGGGEGEEGEREGEVEEGAAETHDWCR
jgi:hypothetical protein